MKRSLFSAPEDFTMSPLLALLPVIGQVGKLEDLTASLYARHEKVVALKKSLALDGDSDPLRRLNSEASMLAHVLEYLDVTIDKEQSGS